MNDLTKLTIEELKQGIKDIQEKNAHWLTCKDGSYGMAMASSAYYDYKDELDKRVI
jgi:hypothetical protein